MELWLTLLSGAVGGAIIAGIFELYRAVRADKRARAAWYRDKKLDAYGDCLAALISAYDQLHEMRGTQHTVDQVKKLVTGARPARLRMLAPTPVADQAQKLYERLIWMGQSTRMEDSHPQLVQNKAAFVVERLKLENALIADLASDKTPG